jgi:hypothetical protein
MENNVWTNSGASENKTEEKMFTKPIRDGKVEYIEREVDRFDFEGFEVVRKELFSKINCPAVTFKAGSINFNSKAVRKFEEHRYIQILINSEKKLMIAKPCEEYNGNSVQWSKINKKTKKIEPKNITGKEFSGQLFKTMKWGLEGTFKILGTLITIKEKNEKFFEFKLVNAESYLRISAPSPDNPKRHERVPLVPLHWQGRYGLSPEENEKSEITTIEKIPYGFVAIEIPKKPYKKSKKKKSKKKVKGDKKNDNI